MLKNLLLMAAALTFGVGAIEAALRLGGYRFTGSFFVLDTERGWSLRPNARGWQTSEGLAAVRINSEGMRDREYEVTKPAGTLRVAVLGDSFTEAFQVEEDKTFVKVLERAAARCGGGRRVEVMNFGIGGHGTGQELLTFRAHARKYNPDLVLLAFFTENDVLNNHEWLNPSSPHTAPHFRLDKSGQATYSAGYANYAEADLAKARLRDRARGLVNYSRLLQMAMHIHTTRRLRAGGVDNPRAVAELGADYAERIAYLPPSIPAMEEAWRITEALLLQLRDEAAAAGAGFRMVTLTSPMQVMPGAGSRAAFQHKIGAETLFYPEQRLREFAARSAIRITTLAERMQAMADRDGTWFHGFPNSAKGVGHWNEAGHKAGGEMMAADVCPDLEARRQ